MSDVIIAAIMAFVFIASVAVGFATQAPIAREQCLTARVAAGESTVWGVSK